MIHNEEVKNIEKIKENKTEKENPDQEVKKREKDRFGIVTAQALRFRAEPNGDVLGYFHKGERLQIVSVVKKGSKETWYRVLATPNGREAVYVNAEFIKDER